MLRELTVEPGRIGNDDQANNVGLFLAVSDGFGEPLGSGKARMVRPAHHHDRQVGPATVSYTHLTLPTSDLV